MEVLLSPVWHQWRDGGFQVVTGSHDVTAARLRRDPRASIVAGEHTPPCRGAEVRCHARLATAAAGDAVRRIASRYLGAEAGAAHAGSAGDDLRIRLEPGDLRARDFAGEFSRGAGPARSRPSGKAALSAPNGTACDRRGQRP